MAKEVGHIHKDEQGFIHKCYHTCRGWFSPGFLAGFLVLQSITFPLEHLQWDHVWGFDYVGGWLDRTGHLSTWISSVWLLLFIVAVGIAFVYAVKHKDQ